MRDIDLRMSECMHVRIQLWRLTRRGNKDPSFCAIRNTASLLM